MNIQEARQAGFEKFLAEQKKWIEEENLEPLTATEIGSMIRAWNAALDSVSVELPKPELSKGMEVRAHIIRTGLGKPVLGYGHCESGENLVNIEHVTRLSAEVGGAAKSRCYHDA